VLLSVGDRLADREQRIDIEGRIERSGCGSLRDKQPAHFIGVLADEVRDVLSGRLALGARLQMALARSTVFNSLITCTGSRMVRDWFMMARSMFCRIHQVA